MEFGICCGLKDAVMIDAYGFDYFEVNANSMAVLSDAEYEEQLQGFLALRTPVRSTNVFFSGDTVLVGPERDLTKVLAYVEHVVSRVSKLGVKVMVFGSGAARRYREPLTYPEAIRELIELLGLMDEIAAKYDIRIVLEPLSYVETNIINTVDEAASLVASLNLSHIGVLADVYHMYANGEPLDDLARLAPLDHIHIATRERKIPVTEEQMFEILDAIRASGYRKRVSIEAGSDNYLEDTKRALELFRAHAAR